MNDVRASGVTPLVLQTPLIRLCARCFAMSYNCHKARVQVTSGASERAGDLAIIIPCAHGSIDQGNTVDRICRPAVVLRLVLRRLRDGRRLPHRLREQRSRRLPYGTDARSKSVPVIRGLATTTLRQRRSFQTPSCATPGVHLPPGVPRLWLNRKPVRYAAAGGPNQVVSASARPRCWPSPTHAACPSGRINTAVGAVTAPSAGSSHTPSYLASTD